MLVEPDGETPASIAKNPDFKSWLLHGLSEAMNVPMWDIQIDGIHEVYKPKSSASSGGHRRNRKLSIVVELEIDFSLKLGSAKVEVGLWKSNIKTTTKDRINYYFDNGILGGIFHINDITKLSKIWDTDYRLRVWFNADTNYDPWGLWANADFMKLMSE